jgi:large subunit ribosomal protein L21
MFAVFKLSGFEYSGEEGAVIKVPLQKAEAGTKIEITDVMLVKDGDKSLIGTPFVENAMIEAEVLGDGKGDKVIVYKKKRRTKYRLTQGHRQDFTEIKINKISAPTS